MLQPPNYQSLFDFVYPTSQLYGLANPCQINVNELNIRYQVIRTNQQSIMNALGGIVAEADEGTYFREFMLPYSETAAAQRTVLSPLQYENAQFLSGYDGLGLALEFPFQTTVFPMTNLGGTLTGEGTLSTMVFSGGKLLRAPLLLVNPAEATDYVQVAQDYYATAANGGVIFYVNSGLVEANSPVDTLVVRNFNKFGTTWPNGAGSYTQTYGEAAASPTTFAVENLAALGNVYDISTYQVFCKAPGDSYFRPVGSEQVAGRVVENGGAVFTLDIAAEAGMVLMLLPISGYWDYQWPGQATTGTTPGGATITVGGPVTAATSQQFEVPLLEYDLSTPAPVRYTDDVDVFVDGAMLRPHVDFVVNWGSALEPGTPPRIVIYGMLPGPHDIRCVANAPYDQSHSIQLQIPALQDPRGLVLVPKAGRQIRLMDGVGLLWSQGGFDGHGTVSTVGENLGLNLAGLTSESNIYYRARFCLTQNALQMCESAMTANLGLDKFLQLFGATGSSTVLSYDYQTAYAESAGIEGYSVPTGPAAPWAPPFETGYYWVRDRVLAASAAVPGGPQLPVVTSVTDFSLDARIRDGTGPTGTNPYLDSWAEPPWTPGAGGVGFDGRPKPAPTGATGATGYAAYPDLNLDMRGVTLATGGYTGNYIYYGAGDSAAAVLGPVVSAASYSYAYAPVTVGSTSSDPIEFGYSASGSTSDVQAWYVPVEYQEPTSGNYVWGGFLPGPGTAGAYYVVVRSQDLTGFYVSGSAYEVAANPSSLAITASNAYYVSQPVPALQPISSGHARMPTLLQYPAAPAGTAGQFTISGGAASVVVPAAYAAGADFAYTVVTPSETVALPAGTYNVLFSDSHGNSADFATLTVV